jgi:DNA-directed RNA polymerase sigma subunit (sigma70/sigma32)
MSEQHPPDSMVEAHRIRMAAEHQENVLPGLSDDRLRVVRARLLDDGDDPVTLARLGVVDAEIRRRTQRFS